MAQRKKTKKRSRFPGLKMRLRRRGWLALAAFALIIGLIGGSQLLWSKIKHGVIAEPHYLFSKKEQIKINMPPDWIRSDIVDDVIGEGVIQTWNITDPELAITAAQAFATHPWVARVIRVAKEVPAQLNITLEYRRPLAMVEVISGDAPGLLPIDAEAVLLPPNDFSPNDASRYPRIALEDSFPVGPTGTPWGDRRIVGAALVIEAIEDHWDTLGFYQVVLSPESSRDSEPIYYLMTKGGARVRWGHMPGHEDSSEARSSIKVSRLVNYVAENGPFDSAQNQSEIDVSDARRFILGPRTANAKLDGLEN